MSTNRGFENLLAAMLSHGVKKSSDEYVRLDGLKSRLVEIQNKERAFGVLDNQDIVAREQILMQLDRLSLIYGRMSFSEISKNILQLQHLFGKSGENTMINELENHFALIVGVGDYLHPTFGNLPITISDVQSIERLLINPERCGYAPQNVRSLTGFDASIINICAGLEDLSQKTNSGSTVFIYFSGHGGRKKNGNSWKAYLCPRGADINNLDETAISVNEFSELLSEIQAQKLIVILDSCHAAGAVDLKSGEELKWKAGLSEDHYAFLSQGSGRVIIASSKLDQSSYILPKYSLSLFTHHLVQALEGGAAVRDDGFIHILDVYHYVNEAVRLDEPKQIPVLKANDLDANFVIALDRGGFEKSGESIRFTNQEIARIREEVIRDGKTGCEVLGRYIAKYPEWSSRKDEVDMRRSELYRIKRESDLFGLTNDDHVLKNKIVFFLLKLCTEIEHGVQN